MLCCTMMDKENKHYKYVSLKCSGGGTMSYRLKCVNYYFEVFLWPLTALLIGQVREITGNERRGMMRG